MEWIKSSPAENHRFATSKTKRLIIYADGGARGNPGPAGAGVIIRNDDGFVVGRISEYIGKKTNNQAEYQSVIMGLQEAANYGAHEVHVHMDSELVVKQMNGDYKVKNDNIKPLYRIARELADGFKEVRFIYIPREKNIDADKLVNQAINLGV